MKPRTYAFAFAVSLLIVTTVFISGCGSNVEYSTCCPMAGAAATRCEYAATRVVEETDKMQQGLPQCKQAPLYLTKGCYDADILRWGSSLICSDYGKNCTTTSGEVTTIVTCAAQPSVPCEQANCTAMACGAKLYRAPSPSPTSSDLMNDQKDSQMVSEPIGLYKSTCIVKTFDGKMLKRIKRSKGQMYVNTFRFGIGSNFGDFEESRPYFPISDVLVGTNTNAYKDRYMNYLGEFYSSGGCVRIEGDPAPSLVCQNPPATREPVEPGENIFECAGNEPGDCDAAQKLCSAYCVPWDVTQCSTADNHPDFLDANGAYKTSVDTFNLQTSSNYERCWLTWGGQKCSVYVNNWVAEQFSNIDVKYYRDALTNKYTTPALNPDGKRQIPVYGDPVDKDHQGYERNGVWVPGAQFECISGGECLSGVCLKDSNVYKRTSCRDTRYPTEFLERDCSFCNKDLTTGDLNCAIAGVMKEDISISGSYGYETCTQKTPYAIIMDSGRLDAQRADGADVYVTYTDKPGDQQPLILACGAQAGADKDYTYEGKWICLSGTCSPPPAAPSTCPLSYGLSRGNFYQVYGKLTLYIKPGGEFGYCQVNDEGKLEVLEHGWCEPASFSTIAVQPVSTFSAAGAIVSYVEEDDDKTYSYDNAYDYCPWVSYYSSPPVTQYVCGENPTGPTLAVERTEDCGRSWGPLGLRTTSGERCRYCRVGPKDDYYCRQGSEWPNFKPNPIYLSQKIDTYLKASIMPMLLVDPAFAVPAPPSSWTDTYTGQVYTTPPANLFAYYMLSSNPGAVSVIIDADREISYANTRAKVKGYSEMCPNCLVGIKSDSFTRLNAIFEYDRNLRMPTNQDMVKHVDFIAFTADLNSMTSLNATLCTAAQAGDYKTVMGNRLSFARKVLRWYNKPSMVIASSGKDDGCWLEGPPNRVEDMYKYIFTHLRNMTDVGMFGFVYGKWKTTDGAGILDYELDGTYSMGDKFCALQASSISVVSPIYSSAYVKRYASETCECQECSQFEIDQGMCNPWCTAGGKCQDKALNPATGKYEYRPTTRNGVKCPANCIINSTCQLCSDSSMEAECLRQRNDQPDTTVTKQLSELDKAFSDIIASLPARDKCCLEDEGGRYSFVRYTSTQLTTEQVLYPTKAREGVDCGKAPQEEFSSTCSIPAPIKNERYTCVVHES